MARRLRTWSVSRHSPLARSHRRPSTFASTPATTLYRSRQSSKGSSSLWIRPRVPSGSSTWITCRNRSTTWRTNGWPWCGSHRLGGLQAQFSIFMDQESRITGTKSSRTMAPGGDGSRPFPFEAALKITTPPPARMGDMTDMTRTGLTAVGTIFEAVSAVIAICAIISKIAHDCYTQQQSAGMRAAQAANDHRLNESNRQLQNNVAAEIAEVIPEQYGNRLPQLNEAVNQIKNGGSQAAEEDSAILLTIRVRACWTGWRGTQTSSEKSLSKCRHRRINSSSNTETRRCSL